MMLMSKASVSFSSAYYDLAAQLDLQCFVDEIAN